MEDQFFRVEVKNTPVNTRLYVVARYDEHTHALWFWGSWNKKEDAEKVCEEINNGIVLRTLLPFE